MYTLSTLYWTIDRFVWLFSKPLTRPIKPQLLEKAIDGRRISSTALDGRRQQQSSSSPGDLLTSDYDDDDDHHHIE